MRKNLANLLQKGNLKPKERMLLLVHDIVKQETEGKGILSEADKHALSEGWKPKDNNEVREYNRYNEAWKISMFANIDAQLTYFSAENSYLRYMRIVDYYLWKDTESVLDNIFTKREHLNGGGKELILKNSGLELNQLIYLFTFDFLSKELKEDILTLYPDAESDRSYLEQEETLYNLLKDEPEPSQATKEKLADLIVSKIYNPYAKMWRLWGYFASIPILEIAKKWADNNNISYAVSDSELEKAEKQTLEERKKSVNSLIAGDKSLNDKAGIELRKDALITAKLDKQLKEYAERQKADIGELLKETVIAGLNNTKEGLLQAYVPIFKSEDKGTCNNADTKLPQKEVFKQWIEAKEKAKNKAQEFIEKGEVKTEKRSETILGVNKQVEIITGESLYSLKGDYKFAEDFRKQIDDYTPLGSLMLTLKEGKFIKEYAELLAFKELFKRLSKTYEIDLTYNVNKWIAKFEEDIAELNRELAGIEDSFTGEIYKRHNMVFFAKVFMQDMTINLEKVKPNIERIAEYIKRIENILGTDF